MEDLAKLFRRRPSLTQLYRCSVLTGSLRLLCFILLTPTRVVGLRTGLLSQSRRWQKPRPFREVSPQPLHNLRVPTTSQTGLYASHSGTLMARAVSDEARLGASVAVIGAGSAGLAAGRVLRDAGKEPFAPFKNEDSTRNRCSPRLQRRIRPAVPKQFQTQLIHPAHCAPLHLY